MAKTVVNIYTRRYPPNTRFTIGGFADKVEIKIRTDEPGESVTDKETYRLNAASNRGSLASLGSANVGRYMFDDGKYDAQKDFSYAMRKDISIVQLDDYIKELTEERKDADKALQAKIDSEIATLNEKRAAIEASENNSDSPTDSD